MTQNGIMDQATLARETVWFDAPRMRAAELHYQVFLASGGHIDSEKQNGTVAGSTPSKASKKASSPLSSEIANVRSKIQNYMKGEDIPDFISSGQLLDRLQRVEAENKEFNKKITNLAKELEEMVKKLSSVELRVSKMDSAQFKQENGVEKAQNSVLNNGTEEDDDIDLFGSDEETEEERRVKEERLKAYENKKSKKAQVVAKSSVVLDVKPWSDETDLKEMEVQVRKIESVGLKWGAAKLVPLAYGVKKLQIIAIVEDDNCSIDWLQEQIKAIEDLVQSVDIAAFNKL